MRLVDVRRHEWASLGWAAGWFFCVLAAYYPLRAVRETYAVDAGPDGIRWLFTSVFLVMLVATPVYGLVAARVPNRWLACVVYGFFASHLVVFRVLFAVTDAASVTSLKWVFYVWVGVFNLFAVTLFWSCAVDWFRPEQAQRLFGLIAGAGTLGGICGSQAISLLSRWEGLAVESMLWIPIGLLSAAVLCARNLRVCLAREAPRDREEAPADRAPTPAGPAPPANSPRVGAWRASMAGVVQTFRSPYLLGIITSVVLVSLCATAIYNQMLQLVSAQIPEANDRLRWFAQLNTYQNSLTLVGQTALASWLIRRWGLALVLCIVPAVYAAGFAAVAWMPSLIVLGVLDVAQRVTSFAIGVPAREVLFTRVAATEKYRAKAFIDTVGKRGGDALSAHGYAAASAAGWLPTTIAWTMLPVTAMLAIVSLALGRAYEDRAEKEFDRAN
jgi:AAA family ATP:ADP antiporter